MDIEPNRNQKLFIPRQNFLYWMASTLDSSADGNSNCLIFISDSKLHSLAQGKTLIFKTGITLNKSFEVSYISCCNIFHFYYRYPS